MLQNCTEGWNQGDGKVAGLFIRQHFEGELIHQRPTPQHPDGKWDKRKIKILEIKNHQQLACLKTFCPPSTPDRRPPQDSAAVYKEGMEDENHWHTLQLVFLSHWALSQKAFKGPAELGPFYSYTLTARRDLWQQLFPLWIQKRSVDQKSKRWHLFVTSQHFKCWFFQFGKSKNPFEVWKEKMFLQNNTILYN